jgi:general secretion pathway protein K
VLLALVAASFSRTTRTEVNLARNLVENAQAEALADAGVHLAILALLDPDPAKRPRADGTPWKVTFGGAEITVSVQDEGGKIDLNQAPDDLLRGLFVSLGVEAAEAGALVDAIADFRDPDDLRRLNGAEDRDYEAAGLPWGAKDAPFEAVEELRQVIGMTPKLYREVASALTVHSRRRGIDPAVAPLEVLLALPGMTDGTLDAVLTARAAAAIATIPAGAALAEDREDRSDEGNAPTTAGRTVGAGSLGAVPPEEISEELSSTGNRITGRRARGGGASAFTVRAEAHTESGAVFAREAVVRLTRDRGQPFRIEAWKQGQRSRAQRQQVE